MCKQTVLTRARDSATIVAKLELTLPANAGKENSLMKDLETLYRRELSPREENGHLSEETAPPIAAEDKAASLLDQLKTSTEKTQESPGQTEGREVVKPTEAGAVVAEEAPIVAQASGDRTLLLLCRR